MIKEIENDGAKAIFDENFSILTLIKTDSYDDRHMSVLELLKELSQEIYGTLEREDQKERHMKIALLNGGC
jgi:hypothetical protein